MAKSLLTATERNKYFSVGIRANWGYWDARNDAEAGRRFKDELWLDRHYDRAYAEGYRKGKNEGEV